MSEESLEWYVTEFRAAQRRRAQAYGKLHDVLRPQFTAPASELEHWRKRAEVEAPEVTKDFVAVSTRVRELEAGLLSSPCAEKKAVARLIRDVQLLEKRKLDATQHMYKVRATAQKLHEFATGTTARDEPWEEEEREEAARYQLDGTVPPCEKAHAAFEKAKVELNDIVEDVNDALDRIYAYLPEPE
ncbi:hypothetical protein DIPPA_29205 [Diplonema papillatum]|nr:hypothetical protein DIPPA_29205 [Diplonema papillatum]|eukprot:gene13636-20982_t